MSSGTSPFATKMDLLETKARVKNLAENCGTEFQNILTRTTSLAICFDAFLAVVDEALPGTADKLKARLNKKTEKKPEEKKEDAQ